MTYGGLGLALAFLGIQVVPPQMPAASAANAPAEAARLLPDLPPSTPEPQAGAALFEITLAYPADGDLATLLKQAGASEREADRTSALLRDEFGGEIDPASDIKLALGAGSSGGGKPIEQLTLLTDLGRIAVVRDDGALRLSRGAMSTRRVDVDIVSGAYWPLRGKGLDARLALEAAALAEKWGIDSGRISTVVGERPARFGTSALPQLLFVALEQPGKRPRRLLKWPGTPGGWIDLDRFATPSAFMPPVNGRISSSFGIRVHPILRFLRPHQGVDFAAGWGTPIRAAADGRVIAAGWRGGYGRQVQLHHGDAVATSYSHLSDMAVSVGSWVKRGQVIGRVGASGLATGPHLHFEVTRFGRRIDPLQARLIDTASAADRSAVAARLNQLNIGSGA